MKTPIEQVPHEQELKEIYSHMPRISPRKDFVGVAIKARRVEQTSRHWRSITLSGLAAALLVLACYVGLSGHGGPQEEMMTWHVEQPRISSLRLIDAPSLLPELGLSKNRTSSFSLNYRKPSRRPLNVSRKLSSWELPEPTINQQSKGNQYHEKNTMA